MRSSLNHSPDVVNSLSEGVRCLSDNDVSNKHQPAINDEMQSSAAAAAAASRNDILPESTDDSAASINSFVGLANKGPKTGSRSTTDMYGLDDRACPVQSIAAMSGHRQLNVIQLNSETGRRWCSGYDVGLATFASLVRVPVMTLLGYF